MDRSPQALSAAFDRLHDLGELYVGADDERRSVIDAQRAADPERASFEYPDELRQTMDRCHREACALVTFVYYELSTLVDLLKNYLAPPEKSSLAYLIAVRHKILTHPRRDARTKRSLSSLTIGPILAPKSRWGSKLRPFGSELVSRTIGRNTARRREGSRRERCSAPENAENRPVRR